MNRHCPLTTRFLFRNFPFDMSCNNCSCENCLMVNRRTIKQNSALHLYFRLLADALNDAGQDMRKTLRQDVNIPWTPISVKENLWKPVLLAYKRKTSTTQMNTRDIDAIYDIINREIGGRTGVFVPFPSIE